MRLIIVSNRAPVTITRSDEGYTYHASAGGVASGLRAYVERVALEQPEVQVLWVGWPGAAVELEDQPRVHSDLREQFGVHPIFFSTEVMSRFYEGFCNSTLWPLFHYFQSRTLYRSDDWTEYQCVNQRFADVLSEIIEPDDIVWVHDYQLMLLPKLLRRHVPRTSIGFFLHIPFPTYEMFRLLPATWRSDLLEGLLGADLVGFHTQDYRTYFLSCVRRLLGIEDHLGELLVGERLIRTGVFPMGIDFDRFAHAQDDPAVIEERRRIMNIAPNSSLIVSVDRQDYTKGILNRLDGFERFLSEHEEYWKRVTLVMIVVPSRTAVGDYQETKSRIDERVGNINGRFGSIDWTPIIYQYRSLEFYELAALYAAGDIALVTPVRDGMNLVAKEYVASRPAAMGVLILSETTGAATELDGAILVNPNQREEVADAIRFALEMPPAEQLHRMRSMQDRVRSYTVTEWVSEFLAALGSVTADRHKLLAQGLDETAQLRLVQSFANARRRIIFLDYDGTLRNFTERPEAAVPSREVRRLLRDLAHVPKTEVILVSGRDRRTLEEWFGTLGVSIAAEHGLYVRRQESAQSSVQRRIGKAVRSWRSVFNFIRNPIRTSSTGDELNDAGLSGWHLLKPVHSEWKTEIRQVLEGYLVLLPGSSIEEKEHSIAFHYRNVDLPASEARIHELGNHLRAMLANLDVTLLRGNKVFEVRNAGIDKGLAAMRWLAADTDPDTFVLAIGDDRTDEDLFRVMPPSAWSIKVGADPSLAKYSLESPARVLALLHNLLAPTAVM